MRRLILAAAALTLAGCATMRPRGGDPGLFLLPPSEAGFTGALLQQVSLTRGEHTLEALASVEITRADVRLAVLSPMGTRLLGLIWDGHHLTQERSELVPARLPAELILRDLQLTFWPPAAIARALPEGWRFEVEGNERRLVSDGRCVIRIRQGPDRLRDRIEFDNEAVGYRLIITPLSGDVGDDRSGSQ